MKTEERNALIEHRLGRAIDAIDDVEFLIENEKFHLAVNRIYYGIFYVLSAISLKLQDSMWRS